MSQLKLAIFDWNGTLLNDVEQNYLAAIEIFRNYGIPAPTREEYSNSMDSDYMNFYHSHGIPRSATSLDINAIRKRFFTDNPNDAPLTDGVPDLLETCEKLGLRNIILSAEVVELLYKKIEDCGIRHYFPNIYSDVDNKETALKAVLPAHNISPKQAFYLDDTPGGINSAKNAGLITFGYTGGHVSRDRIIKAKPTYVVDSMLEVQEILTTLMKENV